MTINDIMMRDMAEEERRRKREDELEEYDREIDRRLWRRKAKAVCEAAGCVVFVALMAAFCWLCCAVSGYHWE